MSKNAVMTPLADYRETLERVRGGTVPATLALEILDVAEREIERVHGEHTLTDAMAMSGRSRSWFERRLPEWERQGLARRAGRIWLVKHGVIPHRELEVAAGFDPATSDDEILRRLRASDEAA